VSPNGKYVVVGSANGNVVVYDTKAQDIEEIYQDVHRTAVVACEWQPRGTKFATIDNLGALYIWTPQ
jgi:WD40 repeat protein